VGGVVGALIGLGVPEYEAKRYEGQIRRGAILMSVHCDNSDWVRRAKDILEETGAEDIALQAKPAPISRRATSPCRAAPATGNSKIAPRKSIATCHQDPVSLRRSSTRRPNSLMKNH